MTLSDLAGLMLNQKTLFLTGAGISVAAGIPAYRTQAGEWARSAPITDSEFRKSEAKRQRYWARSFVGWPLTSKAQPTLAHRLLGEWHRRGWAPHLITQNVDRLHQKAGFEAAIDLHGRLDRVYCLQCGARMHRDHWQLKLAQINPQLAGLKADQLPDGDADLPDAVISTVVVPSCPECQGIVMPEVVFFGGNIPKAISQRTRDMALRAEALVVLGSSLKVYSGYRLCRNAVENGAALVIVNPGPTRADPLATERFSMCADEFLSKLDLELMSILNTYKRGIK
jgi:NAD-dependent SIR2 family protein deacetylase